MSAGRGREMSFLRASRGARPVDTVTSDPWPPRVEEKMFLVAHLLGSPTPSRSGPPAPRQHVPPCLSRLQASAFTSRHSRVLSPILSLAALSGWKLPLKGVSVATRGMSPRARFLRPQFPPPTPTPVMPQSIQSD